MNYKLTKKLTKSIGGLEVATTQAKSTSVD
jgi:hypothetical protein